MSEEESLDQLCADRPAIGREVAGNEFYGSAHVLKVYSGWPIGVPLPVVVPHGVCFTGSAWNQEILAPVKGIFCQNNNEINLYYRECQRLGVKGKKLILNASPLLYLMELVGNKTKPERKGTLFFPMHSTHYITTVMDLERLADELVKLPEKFQPVSVCIFWRDYNLGHHRPFAARGLKIVSAGHMFDPFFLWRLYALCRPNKYSSGNGIGSYIWYSMAAGCQYFPLDHPYKFEASDFWMNEVGAILPEVKKDVEALPRKDQDAQQAYARDYMGEKYLFSPDELRQLMEGLQ